MLALLLLLSLSFACVDPDCEYNDCGGCANACCFLRYKNLPTYNTSVIKNSIQIILESEDFNDGFYYFPILADGAQYFDDLRPYGIDADFIGQTIHTTQKKIYNDTVNISIFPDKVEIHSMSQIGGAYCDNGQNYKNIVQFMEKAVEVGLVADNPEALGGCGNYTQKKLN